MTEILISDSQPLWASSTDQCPAQLPKKDFQKTLRRMPISTLTSELRNWLELFVTPETIHIYFVLFQKVSSFSTFS